jgi:uncharacterized protein with HEPN domain
MSKRDNNLLVGDMVEYAQRAMAYTGHLTYDAFCADSKTVDATIRCLEVIGEACRQMDDTFQANRPEIPWHRIRGLRNRVIHEYRDVDLETVWKVVTEELPRLVPQLKSFL